METSMLAFVGPDGGRYRGSQWPPCANIVYTVVPTAIHAVKKKSASHLLTYSSYVGTCVNVNRLNCTAFRRGS